MIRRLGRGEQMVQPSFGGVMRQQARWVGAAVFLVVAACSCSSSGGDATKPAATTTSSTTVAESTTAATTTPSTSLPALSTIGAVPRELQATFAVLLATSDVQHTDEAGFWYLTLSPALGYAFGRVPSDSSQNTGVLTVAGGTVTFSAERGVGPCRGAGTYRWTAAGDSVTFALVDDPCVVRVAQTTSHPYRRCPGGPATCVRPG